MNEPIRCETCGGTLTLGGELGISCPRCLLSLASEPESQHETGQGILDLEAAKSAARTARCANSPSEQVQLSTDNNQPN